MEAVLNGGEIFLSADVHRLLASRLAFPAWYGGNLDALYDCLTDIGEPTRIRVVNPARLRERLGPWAEALLRVFADAAEANPYLSVRLEEGPGEAD